MTIKSALRSLAGNLLIWGAVSSLSSCAGGAPELKLPRLSPQDRITAETGIIRAACYEAELQGVMLPPEAAAVCRALESADGGEGGAGE